MDQETFSDQVLKKSEMLYRIARTLLKNEEDCRDALSEAILKAWAHRHTLRNEAFFGTWITRILINECHTQLRRRPEPLSASVPAPVPAPAQEQDASGVLAALQALPVRLRLPVTLHYVDGYSIAEIARILRVPQSTVRGRLERGRKALRLELKEEANHP